jgi:hypothetical protein
MQARVRSARDLWAGLLYLGFGGIGLYVGSGYRMGTAAAMGPGYFPAILSGLLLLFGCVSLVRAFLLQGDGVSRPAWRIAAIILGSIAAFTLLLEPLGLIAALSALILGSATASTHFRLGAKPLLAAATLVAACGLVFVHWLRLPMPLLGPWLGGS